jgi:hypothetical protein
MSNKYLEKIAQMASTGSGKLSAPKMPVTKATANRGVNNLRMGPHTTPDDLLPNPKKMDIKVG